MNYSEVNSSGTVAFWSLENTLSDSGGNGYTLIPSGSANFTPTFTQNNPPHGQYSVNSLSASNFFQVPSGLFSSLDMHGPWTMEADVNLNNTSSTQILFNIDDLKAPASGNCHQVGIFFNSNSGLSYGSCSIVSTPNNVISSGQWTNVAYTRVSGNPNCTDSVYVNKNLVAQTTTATVNGDGVKRFYIGTNIQNIGQFVNGSIKNVRISNYVKSLSDIQQGQPGIIETTVDTLNTSGLIANYTFENQFRDSGPSGYHLLQSGTVPFIQNNPPYGQYSAGIFSNSNNYTGNAALNTAMSNLTAGTIEFDSYFNSLAGTPVVFYINDGTNASYMQFLSNGTAFLQLNGLQVVSPVGSIALNQWYHSKLTWDGINMRGYLNNKLFSTVPNTYSTSTVSGIAIGQHFSEPLNGYVKNLKIWNYAKAN